jgi:hypothetical protein
MSFYDDASLVVIPSGYKTSKVYAEKPTDGSGDLAFTRTGDTATRVNSAGLVEKVRTNLALYSEQFDNAAWIKSGSFITANTTIAPDGTTTADTYTASQTNELHQVKSATTNTEYTFSVYVKLGTATNLCLVANNALAWDTIGGQSFNSSDGLNTSTWTRISFTFTTPSTLPLGSVNFHIGGNDETGLTQSSGTVFIWGAQIETGVLTAYIPTTTAAVSVGPVANVPRLDYLGSTCPRLNLEPQRTNLLTFSESFGSAGTLADAVVTSNSITSPDGYANADSFLDNTANSIHGKLITISKAASPVTYTYSLFIKAKDAGMKFQVSMDDAAVGGGDSGIFDPSTGTFVTAMGTPSAGYTNPSRSVTNYGNGWYRISFTMTTASVTSNRFNAFLINAANAVSYIGTGTGIYVYGAQVEEGAYATSYIPTTAASVTRGADAASKTGISSLIGQTEGTLFVDAVLTGKDSANGSILLATDKVSSGAIIRIIYTNANALRFDVFDGTSFVCQISAGAYNVGSRLKIAGAYKANDFILYVNGTQIGTDTNGTVPTTDVVNINTSIYGDTNGSLTNQALLFKTRLTNSELAELTSL